MASEDALEFQNRERENKEKAKEAEHRSIVRKWAEEILRTEASVIHLPTLSVGKAKKLWDGEVDFWKDAAGNELLGTMVLELSTGHGLIASPEAFLVMEPSGIAYYAALQAGIGAVITTTSKAARAFGVDPRAGYAVLVAVLRSQLAALQADAPGEESR